MADVVACAAEFEGLSAVLEEKCGNDAKGHSEAPPSSNIRNALQAVREQVERFVKSRGGGDATVNGSAASVAALGVASPSGHSAVGAAAGSREDAFRTLLQVADFFRRTEPHSPIPYLLDQAVRWGKMPLPELLNELLPADAIPTQSFKLVGIQMPERKD